MTAAAAEVGYTDVHVSSAGVRAVVGSPIHPYAAAVLEGLGGCSTGFRARQFTPRVAMEADLIVTMTVAQRDAVLEAVPRLLHRTFTLSEASQLASQGDAGTVRELASRRPSISMTHLGDIPDPIGRGMEVFEAIGLQIAHLLPPVLHFFGRLND